MKFNVFCDYVDEIKDISSNNEIENRVSELIDLCDYNSLGIVPRFVMGKIFADYDNRNLGVSTSLIRKSISNTTGQDEDTIKSKMPEVSDMGELFDIYDIQSNGQQVLGQQNLTVNEIYTKFENISETSGAGSQKEKVDMLSSMYTRCDSLEAKYLTRLANDNLSIGVGEGTVRTAIAKSYSTTDEIVERALMFKNDTGEVAQIADEGGEDALKNITISVCDYPIKPMKAKKRMVTDVMDDIDQEWVYGEYKYDGFRIQIHKSGDQIKIYTNKLEDVTDSLPDVVEMVRDNIDAEEVILDGEAVGYQTDSFNEPVVYRKTQKRIRRKHNIDEMVDEIPIKPKIFDVLYYDNEVLIDEKLSDRRKDLNRIVPDELKVEGQKCYDSDDIQEVITNAENDGHEGAMTKNPDSTYQPNKRGIKWLKLKPEGETIDAVVVGGEYGDGRRSDDISTYQVALWNEDTNKLEGIGSVGNGFTDEEYEKVTEILSSEIISQDGRVLDIRPSEVFEIKFEEVQDSPEYESGYGLRFPRIINRRIDKSVDEADSVSRLEDIADQM